ncbi:hypothetical protein ABVT39_011934 [Epinephelus coioides]
MMAEFRWIIMSLFLMLLFKFTAAATEKYSLVGDEVTLSCENVKYDQDNCDSATWLFSDVGNTVTLFEHGKIHRESEAKSDRLSVTAKCSLVIKKVTREDVGRYTCRQFRSGRQVSDSEVDVSVVTMIEFKDSDRVILDCSVRTYEQCLHTVKWLYEGNQNDLETSQSTCLASVTFTTSDYNQKLKYSELLKCEVTDGHTKEVHQFTFSPPQSSGHDAATESASTTGNKWTSVKRSTSEGTNTASENNDQINRGWWRFIVASVGLAALIISVVTVNIWTRTKGNKTQMDENMEHIEEDEDEGWWRFIVVSVGLAALIISVVTVNIWTRTKGNKTQMDENMEHIEEDEDEGHDATTAATTSTTTESPSTTGNKWTSVTMSTSEVSNSRASENNQTKQDWWKFIVAAVGLAALIIIIITVAVIRCKRSKGNKTQMEENMADPEADVSLRLHQLHQEHRL